MCIMYAAHMHNNNNRRKKESTTPYFLLPSSSCFFFSGFSIVEFSLTLEFNPFAF